jgi:hypothetical protein
MPVERFGLTTLAGVDPKVSCSGPGGDFVSRGSSGVHSHEFRASRPQTITRQPTGSKRAQSSICWPSVQGLGNGFLSLVLIVAAIVTEAIDCHQPRSAKVPDSAGFSWVGLAAVAVVVFSAKRRRGDAFVEGKPPATVHRKALAGGSDLRPPVIL